VYISPTWGDASLEPIATEFGNSLYLTEVNNRSKCVVDWYSSFGSGEVQNLPFLIRTITGTYHGSANALARDSSEYNVLKCWEQYLLLNKSILYDAYIRYKLPITSYQT